MNKDKEKDMHRTFAEIPNKDRGSAYKRVLRSNEEPGRKILRDPIAFALEFAPDDTKLIGELFCAPVRAVEETLDAWWTVLEIIATRESSSQMLDALGQFNGFVTNYWLEGHRQGVAIGVVMEQYRHGLLEVLSDIDRDLSYSDGVSIESLSRLCKKYGISANEDDLGDQKESIAAD